MSTSDFDHAELKNLVVFVVHVFCRTEGPHYVNIPVITLSKKCEDKFFGGEPGLHTK